MSRPPVGEQGLGRVAVVGAPTDAGNRVREALVDHGVAGTDVGLFGTSVGEAILTEYAGEARLVQEPDLEEIRGYDVVFLCETGTIAQGLAAPATSGPLVIDVAECLTERPPTIPMDSERSRTAELGRCFAIAHPIAVLLAEVLHPLEADIGIAEASAVVLRPASDFGEPGVEELREQTVQLLSFSKVSVDTFGRQLAFNVLPHFRESGPQAGLESRIIGEVGELMGWSGNRLAVRLATVPLFHGHAIQLRFRLERTASLAEVSGKLTLAGLLADEPGPGKTPLDVTGEARTVLADLADDGLGGFWVWVVAGEAASRSARQAVRLAARLRAA